MIREFEQRKINMISLSKKYSENIEREENKHYAIFINNLIANEKIEDKYLLLLEENDIVNIIVLYMIHLNDKIDEGQGHKYSAKDLKEVGLLFGGLNFEVQKRMLFSLGATYIIKFNLDEADVFREVFIEISQYYSTSTNAFVKVYNNNISK